MRAKIQEERGRADLGHVTDQVDLVGWSVQRDFLSWRCDLAKLNPKYLYNCNRKLPTFYYKSLFLLSGAGSMKSNVSDDNDHQISDKVHQRTPPCTESLSPQTQYEVEEQTLQKNGVQYEIEESESG